MKPRESLLTIQEESDSDTETETDEKSENDNIENLVISDKEEEETD